MDLAKDPLVHTEQAALVEPDASTGPDRASGPGEISSAEERHVHTVDVSGSNPLSPTTTTFKGDISEALAIAAFMQLGYFVSRPVSNGLPYDFIADNGRSLMRIQVKTGRLADGTISARLGSSKYHRSRRESIGYLGRVEWVCIVNPHNGRCYVIRPEDAGGYVMLRLTPSRNSQEKRVRWASDYELGVALGPATASTTPSGVSA